MPVLKQSSHCLKIYNGNPIKDVGKCDVTVSYQGVEEKLPLWEWLRQEDLIC